MRTARIVAVLLATSALALLVAACGGDSPSGGSATETTPATTAGSAGSTAGTTGRTTSTESDGQPGAPAPDGRQVFADAGCGGCHTLGAAGASGQVGPNLDQLKPTRDQVETQVRNGGGGMPAFEGELTADEIDAVATFVSSSAGG